MLTSSSTSSSGAATMQLEMKFPTLGVNVAIESGVNYKPILHAATEVNNRMKRTRGLER